MTDPPATLGAQIALLAQYAASSFATSGAGATPVTDPAAGAQQPFLTPPQHA